MSFRAPPLAIEPPARRFPQNRRVVAAGLAVVTAAAVPIIVARHLFTSREMGVGQAPVIRSIAVLPLENLSQEAEQDYFADGITEALISDLAQIRTLKVISRTSIMHYKRTKRSLPEIARELGVDAVLEGSVQRSNGRVRITANLIRASTDTHLWSQVYDSNEADILTLENQVASAVTGQVRVQATAEEHAHLAAKSKIDPKAHDAYLLGRHHLGKNNEQDAEAAVRSFQRAIEIEPRYASAYASLSEAWRQMEWAAANRDAPARARTAAEKAIFLDGGLAAAHTSLGRIKVVYERDWAGAEREYLQALRLQPGDVDAHISYGHLLAFVARYAEAARQGQIAVELDPLSSKAHSTLGRILFRARRYPESLQALERALELEPRNAEAMFRLGDTYTELGRYGQAIAAYEKTGELVPKFAESRAAIARVYALQGRKRQARKLLATVRIDRTTLAEVYAALGERDKAIRLLQEASENPEGLILPNDPAYDSLHSDPRWPALMHRLIAASASKRHR
jgi:adenylate cyclase